MQCGGTQTRRQQERRGTPKPGRGAARGASFSERSAPRAPVSGCPAPLLPSPGLRSDPAQCNKRSPKVTLTQAPFRRSPEGTLQSLVSNFILRAWGDDAGRVSFVRSGERSFVIPCEACVSRVMCLS